MKKIISALLVLMILATALMSCNDKDMEEDASDTAEAVENTDDTAREADEVFREAMDLNPIDLWYNTAMAEGYIDGGKLSDDYIELWREELAFVLEKIRYVYNDYDKYSAMKQEVLDFEEAIILEYEETEEKSPELSLATAQKIKEKAVELKLEFYLSEIDFGRVRFTSLKWQFEEKVAAAYEEMVTLYADMVSLRNSHYDEFKAMTCPEGTNEEIWQYIYDDAKIDALREYTEGYDIKDINGDGVDELVLLTYNERYIKSIYTYIDGSPKRLELRTGVSGIDKNGYIYKDNTGYIYKDDSYYPNTMYSIETLCTDGILRGIYFGYSDVNIDDEDVEYHKIVNGETSTITKSEYLILEERFPSYSNLSKMRATTFEYKNVFNIKYPYSDGKG